MDSTPPNTQHSPVANQVHCQPPTCDALPIRADAKVLAATLSAGQVIEYPANPERHQYLVAPVGRISVNGVEAQARDGVAITGEHSVRVEALDDTEVVMVDAI